MTTSPSAACSGRLAGFAGAVHSGRDRLHELVDAFAGPPRRDIEEDIASFVGEARIAGLSVAGRDYLAGRHRALAGQCGCDEGLRQQDGLVKRRIARSPSIAGTRLHSVRVSASSTVRSRTAYR